MPKKEATFKERLEIALKYRGLNREKLSTMCGLNKGTLSKYVNNIISPKIESVQAIANALDVNPVWLIGYNVPMLENTIARERKEIDKILETLNQEELERVKQMLKVMFPNKVQQKKTEK